MRMKAVLSNYRQSPRKVRLVADAIRGKSVERARRILMHGDKKSTDALLKLLDSALANARHAGENTDNLYVKDIMVDLSLMLKRMMPRARGRGAIIRHRYSRVVMTLSPMVGKETTDEKKPAVKKTKTAAKKTTAKKTAAKKAAK